jgi:anti-sigma factor RsiW
MKHSPETGISSLRESIDQREHLVAYLLGELPPEEEISLEQEYFVDDAAYERVLMVEDELAYEFVEGRLSPERRLRFEKTVGASDRGRQNVAFAEALLVALRASQQSAARPFRYWAIAAAAVLILSAASVWLAFRVAGLNTQLAQLRTENAASQAKLETQLSAARSIPAPAPIETAFLLTPGLSRSADGPPRLELSTQAGIVRFELVAPPGASGGDYVIVIRTASGGQVWSQTAPLSGRTWTLQAAAKLFSTGSYEIAARRLTSGEQAPDLTTYSFRMIRK